MKVYAATIWYRDNDPLLTVVAKTAAKAKTKSLQALKLEARRAYNNEEFDQLYQAQNALAWSGVHAFDLKDLASGREYSEALADLKSNGFTYL